MPNPTEGPTWLLAATWLPWSLVGEDPIFDVIAVIGLVAFGAFVWRNRSRCGIDVAAQGWGAVRWRCLRSEVALR